MYRKTANGGIIYLPLILIQLLRAEKSKSIYNITEIELLKIRIKAQRIRTGVMQSHRCQNFGYNQVRWRQTHTQKEHEVRPNSFNRNLHQTQNIDATCAKCGRPHPPAIADANIFPKTSKWQQKIKQPTEQHINK